MTVEERRPDRLRPQVGAAPESRADIRRHRQHHHAGPCDPLQAPLEGRLHLRLGVHPVKPPLHRQLLGLARGDDVHTAARRPQQQPQLLTHLGRHRHAVLPTDAVL